MTALDQTRQNFIVERVCTAYESGFGRGLSGRDLAQPYADGCAEAQGYFLGYSAGLKKRDSVPSKKYLLEPDAAYLENLAHEFPHPMNIADELRDIASRIRLQIGSSAETEAPLIDDANFHCNQPPEASGAQREADAAFDKAIQAAGVPLLPLEVYDSNSWRRVGLKERYHEVMAPCVQRDGQPDIRGTDLLRAMVAAFNAMLLRHPLGRPVQKSEGRHMTQEERDAMNRALAKSVTYVCETCGTELAFEDDVCGLCNPVAQP